MPGDGRGDAGRGRARRGMRTQPGQPLGGSAGRAAGADRTDRADRGERGGRAGEPDPRAGYGPWGGGPDLGLDPEAPIFVISVAAQLAGMHPQTLRQYDRLGLVTPGRTAGRGRRYSARDVAVLREVQRLSQEEGVNLAGIKRILELELQVSALREHARRLAEELEEALVAQRSGHRVFAAGPEGDIVAVPPGRRPERPSAPNALVLWRPFRRR
jgi:MerR family transcriptional regulator/heat shock protein HspR